ncbi:S-receptor-like serine/threonine-protein kinase [Quillaja saponaria]|uniref:S-receptor-like serine/threonine-protein kinase n=1 Tax=Quillaja saponaria TaxID=32244 RepID=A0AAD7L106_QUISA|nr:S-receptor-like serine/threonine-protein kinase [Quillaja saponaria]
MWYKNIPVQTIVGVANRKKPIKDLSGLLLINSCTGNLVLSQNKNIVWAATLKRKAQNPVLQLLDSGNLVLREANDENSENFIWQSFDYPSDTLLPGMKLGKDLRSGLDRRINASSPAEDYWKSVLPNTPIPEAIRYLIQPDVKITHTADLDMSLVDLPYIDAASTVSIPKEQLKELLNQTNFFFEQDLHPVEAESVEAERLKYTVEVCEKPGIKGEDKYCATSLELIIGYTVSKLGKNVQVLTTEIEKETKKQLYNIVKGV